MTTAPASLRANTVFGIPAPARTAQGGRGALLVAPYAVIGLAGGWMAADFFRAGTFSIDAGLRPLLVMMTPIVAATLAFLVGNYALAAPRTRAAALVVAVVLWSGIVTGGTMGTLLWPPHGLVVGAAYGLLCALAFLPAFVLVAASARRIGRARPGSLVDASDRRGLWLATATAVALGDVAALPDWPRYGVGWTPSLAVSQGLGVLALGAVAVLLTMDAAALARVQRACAEADAMRPRDAALPATGRMLDVGLGDRQLEKVVPAGVVYRDVDRVLEVIRGDPGEARGALAWAVARGGVALALSVGVAAAIFAGKIGPG